MTDQPHHEHQHTPEQQAEPADYRTWVKSQRLNKDDYFKRAPKSPIPDDERAAFGGLHYYAVNDELRFELLTLGPVPENLEEELHVQTSDGAVKHGRRAGTFEFTVAGVDYQLVALQLEGSPTDQLFVPFRDGTNDDDTYEAGRYLDLAAQDDGTYDLDFNLAYAPFCAYSPSYSCPLPPRENWLSVRLEAGERNPLKS
jgi:uncharacterized protein (DUF1684 family)